MWVILFVQFRARRWLARRRRAAKTIQGKLKRRGRRVVKAIGNAESAVVHGVEAVGSAIIHAPVAVAMVAISTQN